MLSRVPTHTVDVLISGKDKEQHDKNLEKLLQYFQEANMYLKKFKFGVTKVV